LKEAVRDKSSARVRKPPVQNRNTADAPFLIGSHGENHLPK
jgi:hypothetical protein